MRKIYHLLLSVVFLLFIHPNLYAGPGPWRPVGADTTYPRSVVHSSELAAIKTSLASGQNLEVYRDIYKSALSATPVKNDSFIYRLGRASIAKNAAFVYMMGVKPTANSTVNMSLAEKNLMKAKAILLMEQMNNYVSPLTIDSPTNFDNWQYNSKEVIMFTETYDFLKGGGANDVELAVAKDSLKIYIGNLYEKANEGTTGLSFFQNLKNSQSLMVASAIGLGAVILGDLNDSLEQLKPINWINCAVWNVHNVLFWDIKRQSSPKKNAGYAEGPYFMRLAFANILPFIRSMGYYMPDTTMYYQYNLINRKIRHPWYDSNYTRIYEWVAQMKLPDGTLPPLEDSYEHKGFPELCVLKKQEYLWPMHLSQLDTSFHENTFDKQITNVYDMRADYVAANLLPQERNDSLFSVFPDAGTAVFRSGNDSASTYMAISGKNGNALLSCDAHNQADDASFMMMVNGQMMAIDPGYFHPLILLRDTVATAVAHNTILVDGKGTKPGFPGIPNGSETFIEKYFRSNDQDFAEVRTNYQGTDINRKFMHVRNKYFLIMDHMEGTTPHQYSMLIHGYGMPGFDSIFSGVYYDLTASKRAAWKRRNSGLYAYTNSDQNFAISNHTGVHEYDSAFLQYHNYTSATSNPSFKMSYMTCLQTFKNMQTDTFPVTTLTLPSGMGIAYQITDGPHLDIAVNKTFNTSSTINKTTTGLSNNYTTDAPFIWVSENSGMVSDLFVQKATHLIRDIDTLFTADKPFNLQLLSNGPKSYKGYAGDTGVVHFHNVEYLYYSFGEKIKWTSYDSLLKVGTVYFGAPTYFTVSFDDAKTAVEEKWISQLEVTVYPNPAGDYTNIAFGDFIAPQGHIDIYDLSGKQIRSYILPARTKEFSINVQDLDNGLYLIVVKDASGNTGKTTKLLVNH